MAKGSINKVMILGRLGQDPEVRSTSSGMQVATLSVATTELGKKDQQSGQRGPDDTEWNRCVLFGRNAENAGTYLKKGSQVYLEGRLRTNKWQDKEGNDRYTTEIVCNEMQFMGGKSDNEGQQQQQSGFGQNLSSGEASPAPNQHPHSPERGAHMKPKEPGYNGGQPVQQPAPQNQPGGFDDFDDDIPF